MVYAENKEMHSKIIAELPETIAELIEFEDTITEEPEFVEVETSSPRFADTMESLPVFVVTGLRIQKMKKLYDNLIHPTFEARLPTIIVSIEDVAAKLVQVSIEQIYVKFYTLIFSTLFKRLLHFEQSEECISFKTIFDFLIFKYFFLE